MKRESGDLMDQFIKKSGAVPAAVSPLIVSENTFATVGQPTGGKAFRNRTSQKTCHNPNNLSRRLSGIKVWLKSGEIKLFSS